MNTAIVLILLALVNTTLSKPQRSTSDPSTHCEYWSLDGPFTTDYSGLGLEITDEIQKERFNFR